MIGPGGLLLVIPSYLQSLFHSYGRGCKKVHNQTWMWEVFLQGHILSTGGRALRTLSLVHLVIYVCLGSYNFGLLICTMDKAHGCP